MLDARRDEVYCRLVDPSNTNGQPLQAKVIEPTSYQQELDQMPIAFFGNGAAKCREIIKHSNAHFFQGIYPQASALGELAILKWKKQQTEDLTTFEPHYLKEFVAKTPRTIF
jgi:tRNA threonylcarbamoyladenosine biosynthesis protein TsaB